MTDYSLLFFKNTIITLLITPYQSNILFYSLYDFSTTPQKLVTVSFLLKIQTLHMYLCVNVSAGQKPSSVVTDGSPLLGSISMSFTVSCCCCRCSRRFDVFLSVERVLIPPEHNLHLTFIFLPGPGRDLPNTWLCL